MCLQLVFGRAPHHERARRAHRPGIETTTARIIAKGMNCIGPDGTGGPTTDPCGQCEHCTAIMEGRHVDVMEMDAASNTGFANIRALLAE